MLIRNTLLISKKNKKGSILAFSLIILSMMLTIAIGIASIEVIQKKNASATQFSVQAYQVADGGTQWAIKIINNATYADYDVTVTTTFQNLATPFTCASGGVVDVPFPEITGEAANFDLSFYKADGSLIGCGEKATLINEIKSTGKYHNTVRAVNVVVGAQYALPIAYWKMDDIAGTNVTDSSGNGYTGALTNGAAWTTSGKRNGAIDLDGVNDYADMGSKFATISTAVSISMWVKPAATQVQNADIWGNHGAFTGMVLQQDISDTNKYIFAYGTGTAWNVNASSTKFTLAADIWQHVVITKDENFCFVYVNGAQVSTASCAEAIVPSATTNFMVGQGFSGLGRAFKGQVDEVKIFDYSLSSSNVQTEYNGGN